VRLHLFELEDQAWFPDVLRDAGTAYLRKVAELFGQPGWMAPTLAALLRETGDTHLIDLCSGGGGPIPQIVDALRAEGIPATALLTDRHPNRRALQRARSEGDERIASCDDPVDATRVPATLRGVRTLFNAFHHFRPETARSILADAVASRQPIAIFEVVERSPQFLIGILFSPILVWVLLPFLRPFDWRWIVFTYLIPLIPLFVVWDGFVSGLRVYGVDELRRMTASLSAPSWEWRTGRIRIGRGPASLTFLTGRPLSEATGTG